MLGVMNLASEHADGGTERPRTSHELAGRFRAYGYVREEQIPDGEQALTLLRLLDVYERAGLLRRGRPVALCRICRHARTCWAGATPGALRQPQERFGEDDEDGSICLPWVGPSYRPGGLVVLGINPNVYGGDYTDLLIDHGIVWDHWIAGFREGRRAEGGSRFGFGAMRTAAGLLDVLDRQPVRDREPDELVEATKRIARIHAIKCVPRRSRSRPFPSMWSRCPALVLRAELEILEPRILLVLGEQPGAAVADLPGFRAAHVPELPALRGELELDTGAVADVYSLPHPAARTAEVEERGFLQSLSTRYQREAQG